HSSCSLSPVGHCALHSSPTRRSSDLTSTICSRRSTAAVEVRHHRGALGSRPLDRLGSVPGGALVVRSEPRSTGFRGRRASTRARDRKSTRLNSSHVKISYAVFCLKKK